MSLRIPPLLLALPLLGIARLLPEYGVGLWLRLVAATLVLLLPGRLVARALGRTGVQPRAKVMIPGLTPGVSDLGASGPGASGALAWSCALVAAALAFTFAVHASLDLTLALVLVAGVVALPFSSRGRRAGLRALRGRGFVAFVGIFLGIAVWSVEGVVHGDALFHLGRVRKLDELGSDRKSVV